MKSTSSQEQVRTGAPGKDEDVVIPSVCTICYNNCGILVRRKNGVIRKIEGNPKSPYGLGRICAKGTSGIPLVYDPSRVNYPLKRTNPEKGLGIDPGWVRISWDEAMNTITEKLSKVRKEDPRKLVMTSLSNVVDVGVLVRTIFAPAFGTPNIVSSNGHHCGSGIHHLVGMTTGATTDHTDFEHCKYLLLFGCGAGGHAFYSFTTAAQRMADARARGMKLVVVDPQLSGVAEKADEWVPIRPGTDGAMIMAMLNLLLNEYKIYDEKHLKHLTDAPYLVNSDGLFARDEASGKPLVWDTAAQEPKTFDDPSLTDYAMTGCYETKYGPLKTVFQLLKERVAPWTPEKAADISSVPADVIRRIAREFGEEARIGSTIEIQGEKLPYRPVSILAFKGSPGHDNHWLTSLALKMLCDVVGSAEMPGGTLSCNPVCYGHPETGLPYWDFGVDKDGILAIGRGAGLADGVFRMMAFRAREGSQATKPVPPTTLTLNELFVSSMQSVTPCMTMQELDKFRIPYKPEVWINCGPNLVMSAGDPRAVEAAMKQVFVISFNLHLHETTDLADIVLPDACYLERLDPIPNMMLHHLPVGLGDWGVQIRQPVIEPLYERRPFREVIFDLIDRLGMRNEVNTMINVTNGLQEKYALKPGQKYSVEEIADRQYKNAFGDEHGLEWFKANGVMAWPKTIKEVYWRHFVPGRTHIYWEQYAQLGRQVAKVLDDLGIQGVDTSNYDPLPNWKPCGALRAKNGEFDLQAIYYRVAWHQFSFTYQNPWLDEISQNEPYSYFACVHTDTGKKKGLKDGDLIWIHSAEAGQVLGRVKLTEGVHPEVVAIANNGGHWSRHMPIAKGKGVFFQRLMPLDWKHLDPVTQGVDCDAAVKIYKAREDEPCEKGWL